MSNNKKRPYNSTSRDTKAAETKQRILTAARELFSIYGFDGITIERIALEAQVSIPTVYSIFQSKKGILFALIDEVVHCQIYDNLLDDTKKAKTAKELLKKSAHFARVLYDTERAQIEILHGSAVLGPEFKELENKQESRRFSRQEWVIELLCEKKLLTPKMTRERAHDILWTYTGRDIFRVLVLNRGWSLDEYEEWLAEALITALLDPDKNEQEYI